MPKRTVLEKGGEQSPARFERIFRRAPAGICVLDGAGAIRDANDACAELLGLPRTDLLGAALERFVASGSRDRFHRLLSTVRRARQDGLCELQLQKSGGVQIPVRLAGRAAPVGKDRTPWLIIALTDLSGRTDRDAKLNKSGHNYQLMVENANEAIVVAQNGFLRFANHAAARLSGFGIDELLRRPFIDFVHPDDRQRVAEHHRRRIAGEEIPEPYEMRVLDSRGNTRWVINNAALIEWEGQNAVLIFFSDTTESRIHRERIRKLSQRLLHAQEAERRMISSELHDRVAQNLSAAKMACDSLAGKASGVSTEAAQSLREVSHLIQHSISAARDLSYEMSPPGLAELGLVATLSNFCHDFAQKTGTPVDFRAAGMQGSPVSMLIGISVYRSVQEAMNNVRKHARAGRIAVRLVKVHPHIVARVEDDGVGFDVEEGMKISSAEKRMGLFSIQQRMQLLGGEMTIRSEKGIGTRLAIRVPVEE